VTREVSVIDSDIRDVTIFLEPVVIPVDGVSVTATRFSADEFSLPIAASITSSEEFCERSSSTTAELLREEPGILVQKTTCGHGAPIVRGLIGKHVLLLYDGIRLNKSTFRFGANQYLNTIDHESLSKIEVIRGPSSVPYGSDAIGGTINLIPIAASSGADSLSLVPTVIGHYSSSDNGRSMHVGLRGNHRPFSSFLGITHKKRGDLRAGGHIGIQHPTGWEEVDLTSRIVCLLSRTTSITLDYVAVRQQRVPRFDKYVSGDFSQYIYDPQDRDLVALTFLVRTPGSVAQSLKCNLSYQHETEGRISRRSGSSVVTSDTDKISTWGGFLELSSSPVHRHWLSCGCEYYTDGIESRRTERFDGDLRLVRPAFPDNSRYRSAGMFIQDEYSITDKLRTTLGLRYSLFGLDSPLEEPFGSVNENYSDLTGALALSCRFAEEFNLVLRWSRGFRAPNLNDVVVLKYSGTGVDAPSTGLRPESCDSYEIGVKAQAPGLKGSLFCFYSQLGDLIERKPGFYDGKQFFDENGNGQKDSSEYDIFQRYNVGRSRLYGIEFDNTVSVSDVWEMRANCFWTWGENQIDSEPLSRIPPLMGRAAIRMNLGSAHWLEVFVRAAGSQRRLSPRDKEDTRIDENGTASWATVNLRSRIRIGQLGLNATLENIADTAYKEHGSGVYSPGRNFVLSIRYGGE
jgi:outer membrane receptor protein involved in Fe transport